MCNAFFPQHTDTNYDLNQDGKINSLDLAIISQNNGKKVTEDSSAEIKQADLNKDGLIDKKDSDLLLTAL
jgi:Ca2+-binding EF-hand superfamily protein